MLVFEGTFTFVCLEYPPPPDPYAPELELPAPAPITSTILFAAFQSEGVVIVVAVVSVQTTIFGGPTTMVVSVQAAAFAAVGRAQKRAEKSRARKYFILLHRRDAVAADTIDAPDRDSEFARVRRGQRISGT